MKFFVGLNAWMLPVAAIASFIFGGIWYGVLSKQWMNAAGLTMEDINSRRGNVAHPFVVTLLCQLIMAWMLAGVILHMSKGGSPATAMTGMITAAFLWLGFVVTTQIVNHQFQMQKASLTAIDSLHWLGVMLIQGALLGAYGIAR